MPRKRRETPVTTDESAVAEAINPTQPDAPEGDSMEAAEAALDTSPDTIPGDNEDLSAVAAVPAPLDEQVDQPVPGEDDEQPPVDGWDDGAKSAPQMEPYEEANDELVSCFARGPGLELVWTRRIYGWSEERGSYDDSRMEVTLVVARHGGPHIGVRFEISRGTQPGFLSDDQVTNPFVVEGPRPKQAGDVITDDEPAELG